MTGVSITRRFVEMATGALDVCYYELQPHKSPFLYRIDDDYHQGMGKFAHDFQRIPPESFARLIRRVNTPQVVGQAEVEGLGSILAASRLR